jgi:hypothetical protein
MRPGETDFGMLSGIGGARRAIETAPLETCCGAAAACGTAPPWHAVNAAANVPAPIENVSSASGRLWIAFRAGSNIVAILSLLPRFKLVAASFDAPFSLHCRALWSLSQQREDRENAAGAGAGFGAPTAEA